MTSFKRISSRLLPSVLLLSGALWGGARQITIELPGKPKLEFQKGDALLIAPFLLIPAEKAEEDKTARKAEGELRSFLMKMLSRSELFSVKESQGVPLPSGNMEKLKNAASYWKTLAGQYACTHVVSGVLDFHIQDRAGYETEEYISPYNGQTYTRQVLVEKSGVTLELLLWVFAGSDGSLKSEENFKHFLEKKGRNQDFITAFFEGVHAFEEGLQRVFLSKPESQKRFFYAF